jgi:hypothetical protein
MNQKEYVVELEKALGNLLDEHVVTKMHTREIEYQLAYWNARNVLRKGDNVEVENNKVIRLDFAGTVGPNVVVDEWVMYDEDDRFRFSQRHYLKMGDYANCESMLIHWGDEEIIERATKIVTEDTVIEALIDSLEKEQDELVESTEISSWINELEDFLHAEERFNAEDAARQEYDWDWQQDAEEENPEL